jgi:UDP-glucose 4-epimerase
MTWLITGGAGYIGAHVARAFVDAGHDAVVLDDLSSGIRAFVRPETEFVEGSMLDAELVRDTLIGHKVTGVVHLAGFKYAGVSVERPVHTYWQNTTATQVLLDAMAEADVNRLVFSSSAAVYGTPDVDVVTEATPTAPESPYGESKLVCEWLIRDVARVSTLQHSSLRYFNVVGSGWNDLYDTSPHNLFPLVLKALTEGRTPEVRGTDYPTPDGSCVRDYVHVHDIALAHVAAAERMMAGDRLEPVYNLGSGDGVSVLSIMDSVARVTGSDFDPVRGERRPGDPARIVASGELAQRDLSWRMRHSLDDMVKSAWEAWCSSRSPEGAGHA